MLATKVRFGIITLLISVFSIGILTTGVFANEPIEPQMRKVNLSIPVNESMPPYGNLSLTNYVSLNRYTGYTLKAMTIHGTVFDRRASIDVYLDGSPIAFGTQINGFDRRTSVELFRSPRLGSHADLTLRTDNPVEIYDVSLVLEK
jgi:hypothetical protein